VHRHGIWIQRFLVALVTRVKTAIGAKVPACAGAVATFWDKTLGTLTALTATNCEWTQFDLGWMFTLFFVVLGSSAAIWGGWLEHAGPRKAGVCAALCWCGGLMISAIGVRTHQLWMLWIGSGVIGGIGLGLGYISPVSTRRRDDRLASRQSAHEPFQDSGFGRRVGNLRRPCAGAAGEMEA
jgi:MFS family permease